VASGSEVARYARDVKNGGHKCGELCLTQLQYNQYLALVLAIMTRERMYS